MMNRSERGERERERDGRVPSCSVHQPIFTNSEDLVTVFLSLVIREALQIGSGTSGSRRDWGIQLEVKCRNEQEER